MSNGKKTREAEQRANMADAAALSAAQQVKLSPQASNVLEQSGKDFEAARSGDVTNIGAVSNFLANAARANEARRRVSPTGAASLAMSVANPSLIAMNNDMLDRKQAQDTALGVTELALDAEDTAAQRIGAFTGMDISAKSAQAGFMFQNASKAWDRYQFEKQHRGFWQNAALAGISAAGNIFSKGF